MNDLLIRGAAVYDGTGAPGRVADVAVKDGRFAPPGPARETLDAGGLALMPGIVDVHTHYDAQVTWDRLLSSSSEHGVTTVVMGNCGVGIAPCRPAHRELVMDDLVTVTVYCPDVSLFNKFNGVYRTYFNKGFPARAFIGSGPLLFGGHFEVQGIAVRPERARLMPATTPPQVAYTVFCIFIASIISSLSPLATLVPTETTNCAIRPGMGAAICVASARSALGRALVFGAMLLSRIKVSRPMPFNS